MNELDLLAVAEYSKGQRAKVQSFASRTFIRKVTNAQFAKSDDNFKTICGVLNLPVTTRQASKFRNKKGKAFKASL